MVKASGAGALRGAVLLVVGAALGAASYALGAAGDHPPLEAVKFVIVDGTGNPVGSLDSTGVILAGGSKLTYLLQLDSDGISERREVPGGGYARLRCQPVRSVLELGGGSEKPNIRLLTGQDDYGPGTAFVPGASIVLDAPHAGVGLNCWGAASAVSVSGTSGSAFMWSGGVSPDSPRVAVGVDCGSDKEPELALVSSRDDGPAIRLLDRATRKLRFELKPDRDGNVRLFFYDRGGKLTKTLP